MHNAEYEDPHHMHFSTIITDILNLSVLFEYENKFHAQMREQEIFQPI